MTTTAHDSTLDSLDRAIDLWPDDPIEDTPKMAPRQRAAMFAALGVGLVTLVLAIAVQTAYHGVILLWIWLVLPLLFITKAIAHMSRAAVDRFRAWSDLGRPQRAGASRQEVQFTFDELALIYKSLQAVKTLEALTPQNELLQDTIQVVDQSLNTFVH
jgi:hypothetical protein